MAFLSLSLGIGLILYKKTAKNSEEVAFVEKIPEISKKIENTSSYESNTVKSEVFASKTGKKYYFSGCSGLKRIKEENKISFESPELAEKAGLTLAANCKEKQEIK